jgi:hypothetical protein
MGNRAQVHVYGWEGDVDVYLYTHWGARDLPVTVRDALMRADEAGRDDAPYIARIIFSEMIKDDIDGCTGYGIDNIQHEDVWRVISVDADERTVDFEGYPARGYRFDEFVDPEFSADIESIPDTRAEA